MSMKNRFWRIEREEGINKVSSMIISTGQITDKRIEELKRILFAKYILNDEEILSNLCKKNSLRHEELISYIEFKEYDSQNKYRIIYSAQNSGISITISLVYENELTVLEKEKINSSSHLNIR